MLKLFIFFLFLLPFSSFSSCNVNQSTWPGGDAVVKNITVQRDTPVGSVVATGAFNVQDSGGNNLVVCDSNGGHIYYLMTYAGGISSDLSNVYKTNVAGIGLKVSYVYGDEFIFNNPATIRTEPANGTARIASAYSYEIIVTGPVSSGELSAGRVGRVYADSGPDALDLSFSTSSTVTKLACNLNNGSSLAFPIGNVPADTFNALGSFSRQTSTQNLGLNCDSGANINVTLKGTQNADSTDPSILALSPGEGVATGVGVQLLYNDKPLELNKLLNLKTSSGGVESFPITARYIQTKDTVTAGAANATATLNITYQ